jgi:hypothetical protein
MSKAFVAGLIIYLWLSPLSILGQEKYTVSGTVKDSLSGEVLISATIYELNSRKAVISNKFGFFSIQLPAGHIHLQISYVGFTTYHEVMNLQKNVSIEVNLKGGVYLDEVQVTAKKKITQREEMSMVQIPIHQIESLPSLFGESDVMIALQHTPGIQSSGEGKTEINVRGGSPDQNLILLDDIPLYNISHFGGFISTFNSSTLKDITLYKGGFPARYGGRLSSVIDVRMKDGNMNKYNVEGMLGLLSSKLMIEGPIVKKKSSFLISFRKNTLPIFKLFYNEPINYNFYDLNLKINSLIGQKDRIYLSFYLGNDKLKIKQVSDFESGGHSEMLNYSKWGNIGGAFRWNHIFGPRMFLNTILGLSTYHYKNGLENVVEIDTIQQHVTNDFVSNVNDYFFKLEPEFQICEFWKIDFGSQSILHTFHPGSIDYSKKFTNTENIENTFKNDDVIAFENSIYLENHIDILKKINTNLGVHYSNYKIRDGKEYSSLEPRVILNYNVFRDISMKASYTVMKQYIHFLTYSGTGMPSDFWMPSTDNVHPQNSSQFAVGVAVSLFDDLLEASLESYYKTMDDLIAFRAGESMFASSQNWEDKIEKNGTGYSKGVELLLQKQQGKTSGWLSFAIAKSERKFENLNNGNPFPYKYDRRYEISLVLVQQIKKGITFSATWDFGTGYPVTIPLEKYNSFDEEVWIYTDINSFRMNNYHRLDIGVNFTKKTKWGERIWNISIYNVYNRKNPYYYYYEREQIPYFVKTDNTGIGTMVDGDMKIYQQSLFSFFPSFSYTFKF